jgi:hypothetical protein
VGEKSYSEEEAAIYLLRVFKTKKSGDYSERLLISDPALPEHEMLEQIARNAAF